MKKITVLGLSIVIISLLFLSACYPSVSRDGLLTIKDVRRLERSFGQRTPGILSGFSFETRNIPAEGTAAISSETKRSIEGYEFSVLSDYVDGAFTDIVFVSENFNKKDFISETSQVLSACVETYGEPITFSGLQNRVSTGIEDMEPGKTYVEYWGIGQETVCCLNAAWNQGNPESGTITIAYFKNDGRIPDKR